MRTRTVHPADMVAHLWAHKSQDFARNPGHNFYFHGDTIYSYGSHFPVARHVENKRGKRCSSPPIAIAPLPPVTSVWWRGLADT